MLCKYFPIQYRSGCLAILPHVHNIQNTKPAQHPSNDFPHFGILAFIHFVPQLGIGIGSRHPLILDTSLQITVACCITLHSYIRSASISFGVISKTLCLFCVQKTFWNFLFLSCSCSTGPQQQQQRWHFLFLPPLLSCHKVTICSCMSVCLLGRIRRVEEPVSSAKKYFVDLWLWRDSSFSEVDSSPTQLRRILDYIHPQHRISAHIDPCPRLSLLGTFKVNPNS